ncbi:MAG: hypothetical protein JWQ32_2070 [Marmoricola sp.]|nr:hypothetical protein [Marmoricola sp.]
MKRTLGYAGGLIALYIVAAHGSAFGKLFTSGASGSSQLVKTLQGR